MWAAVGLSVLLVSLTAASAWWSLAVRGPGSTFAWVDGGIARLGYQPYPPSAVFNVRRHSRYFHLSYWDLTVEAGEFTIMLPLWVPTIPLCAVALLGHVRARRRPLGHCRLCGYDLAGSPRGTCPECGHAAGAKR
jgi:hypothetical protein